MSHRHFAAICIAVAGLSTIGCDNSAEATDPAPVDVLSSLEVTTTTSGDEPGVGSYGIVAYRQAGAEPVAQLPVNGTVTLPSLTPGGYTFKVVGLPAHCDIASPDTRSVNVQAGSVTKLTLEIRCDGSQQLTFEMGGGWDDDSPPREFWTVNLDGRNSGPLTTDGAWHERPAWSPDGSTLAFGSDRGGAFAIWTLDPERGTVRLTDGSAEDFGPRWAPDGKQLVFFTRVDGNFEIFTMKSDGSDRRRLTTGTPGDYNPDWSPDGNSITFSSKRDGVWGIWVLKLDGTGLTRLTSNADGDYDPRWSPDGSTIMFQRITTAGSGIYTMKPDGSALTRIGSDFTITGSAVWSPDGRKIAFTGRGCDSIGCQQGGIQVLGIDGTQHRPVLVADVVGEVAWRARR
jgi:TolB protein